MNNQKIIVESLAMDLKRVSLGLYRGSEALKRSHELESQTLNSYLKILIQRTKKVLKSDKQRVAEDALMYSTLFQNFALNKMGSTNERR